jgi:hypothetical protein
MVTDCSLNNFQHCYWEFSLHHLQTLRDPTSSSSRGGELSAPSSAKVWNMGRYTCMFPLFNTKVKICEGMPVCSLYLVLRFGRCACMFSSCHHCSTVTHLPIPICLQGCISQEASWSTCS